MPEGFDGVYDRPIPGRPPVLSKADLALLAERIYASPGAQADGTSSWTLPDLCTSIEARFGKRLSPQSLSRILRRAGFSHQTRRPRQPKADAEAQAAFEKGGSKRR